MVMRPLIILRVGARSSRPLSCGSWTCPGPALRARAFRAACRASRGGRP